jgi:hypothetical protein
MQLPPLVRRRDEVLAPVLSPLDRAVQQPGCPGDQNLLRPRVHDLDAEATADVGRDALDLGQRQPEASGDGGPHAGRRLRRGPEAQLAALVVPPRVDPFALHRHRCTALDLEVQ